MASRALTTGALTRAPIFANIMTQIGAAGTVPGTPLALSPANRAWIGDMIETLIGVLDHAAGDSDLEDGDLDAASLAKMVRRSPPPSTHSGGRPHEHQPCPPHCD